MQKNFDTSPPNGESLKDTYKCVVPYYKKAIEPQLNSDKNILVITHGNSLRTLMMYLDERGAIEISEVNIATGIPRVYEFSPGLKLETADYLEE